MIISLSIVILCILFIAIILIQDPKKDSINQNFVEKNFKFFGVKKTNSILENITWFLSIFIFLLILVFDYFLK